ncbi:MAG: hypothetical protein IJO66_06240 [Clostridia bacterium]|nr:hypothetical protein [Clostridia bacterium]
MEDRYSSAFDEVRASDDFKARMVDRMRQLNEIEEPVARRAPVSVPRRVRKRTLTILIAAAILLIGGTALAIGLSAMIGTRDRAARAVASYQAVLEGHGVPETVELPVNSVPVPSAYITYSKFQADEAGKWLPDTIPDIDVTAQAGGLTVRFSELISLTEFDQLACYLIVEGEKPVPYALTEIRLSIDGGEPLKTKAEMEREQNRGYGSQPTPTPFEAWNMDDNDTNYLTFPLEGNPLRAGTTFTLTGKLNGEAFTLTYDFTEEKYEQLRQTQLQEVSAIGAVIDAIPDETIPVNVTGRGYLVEEIALADHFIYYVDTLDPPGPRARTTPAPPTIPTTKAFGWRWTACSTRTSSSAPPTTRTASTTASTGPTSPMTTGTCPGNPWCPWWAWSSASSGPRERSPGPRTRRSTKPGGRRAWSSPPRTTARTIWPR